MSEFANPLNADPQQLLDQLKQANQQLLQSEKLAAIGQLAAGVAHEINNPVGYVCSNLHSLESYLSDLFKLTDSIESSASIDEIRALKQTIDYDFIKTDIQDLVKESTEGLERVKKIVASMKDFSHTDEEKFEPADLHHGIETTLNVVNNEVKYKADVIKDFGELPEVECVLSQINQVVMNLLVNAAHAIENFGQITIRTRHEAPWVWFEIEDNGSGMPAESLDRIFDPFYTTKPVGKGTGLGLALSIAIIEKHNGRIDVASEVGKGSRFRVWLPVLQEATASASMGD